MAEPSEDPDYEVCQFLPDALGKLQKMDEDVQKLVARELSKAWSWAFQLTVTVATQSYVHIRDFKSLSLLTKDLTLFIIAGCVFHVKIDHSTLVWTVVHIDTRPIAAWCRVHSIPREPLM